MTNNHDYPTGHGTVVPPRSNNGTWLSSIPINSLVLCTIILALGLSNEVKIASLSLRKNTLQTIKLPGEVMDDEVDLILHNQQWPAIQDILCPAGLPDASFGPKLFAFARTQLGITTTDFTKSQHHRQNATKHYPDRELPYRFFHNQFQNATIYTRGNRTIAYLPIWKAANMAIREWMTVSLAKLGTVEDIATASLFINSTQTKQPSCVVTAIRDPISHFLSGYNEVEFRRGDIADNKVSPRYLTMPFKTSVERRDRFVQFVRDFLLEDILDESQDMYGGYAHVFSMTCILTELHRVGGFLSGYLPSIQNISSEFPFFVEQTCHIENHIPPIQESFGKHPSSQDPDGFYQAAKVVWSEKGEIARALCVLHAIDYACWKALPAGIPLICQEVFSSPDFVSALVN